MNRPYSAKASQDKDEQWLLDEKYGGTPSDAFERDRKRLAVGEPVAYIIGFQPFLGLKIWLDSKPLIPRPETEWWTEELLKEIRSKQQGAREMRFLDLCAGSGAIGCAALAQLPHAHVYFGELEPSHESTIRKNICENHLDEQRSDVRTGDLFAPFGDRTFDIIAANPPYIPSGRTLDASVANHEPHTALFSGDDGLALIRRIAAELPRRLAPGGLAYIECDSSHADSARALFEGAGLAASVIPDQYGVPRVIAVSCR